MADHAARDGEPAAAGEQHAGLSGQRHAVDVEAAKVDRVERPGVDGDRRAAGRLHPGGADAVVDDAERLGDVDGAVAGWVEDVDLATCGDGVVVGVLKTAAGAGRRAAASLVDAVAADP